MLIIDTREKANAIKPILNYFDSVGAEYMRSKLIVGDYMIFKNPTLVIDRKQNIDELANNCTNDHVRFKAELDTAVNLGVRLVILVEQDHYYDRGKRIELNDIDDLMFWTSRYSTIRGEKVYRILASWCHKYPLSVRFCSKKDTGRKILEILEGDNEG